MTGSDASASVREAVARTRDTGSARLRFTPSVHTVRFTGATLSKHLRDHGHATFARVLDSATEPLRKPGAYALSHLGPSGQIDFEHARSLYSKGRFWELVTPSRYYVGRPGEWEASGPINQLATEDPLWLLEVLAGTARAELAGEETVERVACKRYSGVADFELARSRSQRPLESPDAPDPAALPIDVWVDSQFLMRRALCRLGWGQIELELSHFHEPGPLAEPSPDEVID